MQFRELVDKRVVITASTVMAFMVIVFLLAITLGGGPKQVTTSAAPKEDIVYAFSKTKIDRKSNDLSVDVMLKTNAKNRVSAATIVVKYPKDLIQFVEPEDASEECKANNNKLETPFALNNDVNTGTVEITRTALVPDEELPTGNFCFGTLAFTPVNSSSDVTAAAKEMTFEIKKDDTMVVGPKVRYNVKIDPSQGKVDVQ